MKAHPHLFEPLMCSKPDSLSAAAMENIFTPTLSTAGSNRRTVENRVLSWWLDMLQDIEGTEHLVTELYQFIVHQMPVFHSVSRLRELCRGKSA